MEGSSDAGSIPAISTKRKRPIGAFFLLAQGRGANPWAAASRKQSGGLFLAAGAAAAARCGFRGGAERKARRFPSSPPTTKDTHQGVLFVVLLIFATKRNGKRQNMLSLVGCSIRNQTLQYS